MSRHFAKSEEALVQSVFAGWLALLEKARLSQRGKERSLAVAQQSIANSADALLSLCLTSWARELERAKHQREIDLAKAEIATASMHADQLSLRQQDKFKSSLQRQF